MSRDLTPKELDFIQKQSEIPNLTETLKIVINGVEEDAYTEEQKMMARTWPRLGMFGFDLLERCRSAGVLSSETGRSLIDQIESYFQSGETIDDPELQDKTIAWYEGQLVPGYYMTENDREFALYLKQLSRKED